MDQTSTWQWRQVSMGVGRLRPVRRDVWDKLPDAFDTPNWRIIRYEVNNTAVDDAFRPAMGRVLLAGGRREFAGHGHNPGRHRRHTNLETANYDGLFPLASMSVQVTAIPFLLLQCFCVRTLMHSSGK